MTKIGNKLLQDSKGNLSSTRVIVYIVTAFVLCISVYSIKTGNDLGVNVSELLRSLMMIFYPSAFGKMAVEFLGGKNDK